MPNALLLNVPSTYQLAGDEDILTLHLKLDSKPRYSPRFV